ncbi:hypothetical protein [Streptomyces sp. NBC_00347]|uniref:hypothetical protein n=1 Tax=Streptomyces sp. NBC_00347 TaxID=2975721 RepID=UPI002250EBE7|nr:hypothetical protein [Streptomyces sp. NBC_00347]MCX5129256.1 hypothetical protein [Streptomyces sp. NBC_00347]
MLLASGGFIGLIVATLFLSFAMDTWRRYRLVLRTPLLPTAQWRTGSSGQAAQGHLAPGPAGPLIAPFSGEPCVWYYAELRETFDPGEQGGRTTRVIWKLTSAPPALQDGTGSLLLDSALLRDAEVSHSVIDHTETGSSWNWRSSPYHAAWADLPPQVQGPPGRGSRNSEEFNLTERLVREGEGLTIVAATLTSTSLGPTVTKRRLARTIVHRMPRHLLLADLKSTTQQERRDGVHIGLASAVFLAVGLVLAYLAEH